MRTIAPEVPMNKSRIVVLLLLTAAASACGMNLLPAHDEWYARHYFIMQKFENDAYKNLSENGRAEFRKIFWEVRSPVAKPEFEARMQYITENFKDDNRSQPWNCDRARIYLLNGSPASRDYTQNDGWAMRNRPGSGQIGSVDDRTGEDIQARSLEVWSYPFGRFFVYYAFAFEPPNKWKQAAPATNEGRYNSWLELQNRVETWGAQDEEIYKAKLTDLKSIK